MNKTSRSDEVAEAAVLGRAAEEPADVAALAGAVAARLGLAFRREEGGLHAVVHECVRGGRLEVSGRAPGGGALYGIPSARAASSAVAPGASWDEAIPAPEAPPPATRSASRTALRVASGVSDAEDRGRVAADVLSHLAAIEATPPEEGRAFGSASGARESLRRADRGRARVAIAATGADRVRRFAVHELPGILLVSAIFAAVWLFLLEPRKIPSGSMIPTLLPGDRVLVWKPGAGAVPERWSVMTFKSAGGETLIKRVVGLPGEKLQVRDGDLVADGEVLRKPDALRERLRVRVREDAGFEQGPPSGWTSGASEGTDAQGGYRLAEPMALPHPPAEAFHDLYLDAEAPADAKVEIGFSFERGSRRPGAFALGLRREAGRVTLYSVGKDGRTLASGPSPGTGIVALSISVVDGVLRARAPGWSHEEGVATTGGAATVFVLGPVARLTIDRDIHYTREGQYAVDQEYAVPEGHVMAFGDHSEDSKDSRFRSLGPVPLSRLSGRAVVRIWPPWRLGLVR